MCNLQEVLSVKKTQLLSYLWDLVDTALERKKADLASKKAALYPETVRYLTLVQLDNLWTQQLEVGSGRNR